MGDFVDAQTEHAAEWAGQFKPTNLAQRQRYSRDIAAGDELQANQDAVAQERFLQSKEGVGARDLMAKRGAILRGMESSAQGADALTLRRDQFDWQKGKAITDQDLRDRQIAIQEQAGVEKRAKAAFDSANAMRITTDNTAVYDKLGTIDDRPDSAEFATKALRILSEHPHADAALRQKVFGTIQWAGPHEDVQAQYDALSPEKKKLARVTHTDKGMTFTVGPEVVKPVDERARAEKEYINAMSLWDSAHEVVKKDGKEVKQFKSHLLPQDAEFLGKRLQTARENWTKANAPEAPKAAAATAAPSEQPKSDSPKSEKPYTITGDKINFATGSDSEFLNSVNQAQADGHIDPDRARELIEQSGRFKKRVQ